MKLYAITLSAWASPVYVQASTLTKAKQLAQQRHPKCDCCDAVTTVVKTEQVQHVPYSTSIIMEVKPPRKQQLTPREEYLYQ